MVSVDLHLASFCLKIDGSSTPGHLRYSAPLASAGNRADWVFSNLHITIPFDTLELLIVNGMLVAQTP